MVKVCMKKLFSVLLFMSFVTTYCPRQNPDSVDNCIEIAGTKKTIGLVIAHTCTKLKNLRLKTLSDREKEGITQAIKSGGRYSVYRERKNDQLPLELLFGNKKYLHGEDE